MDTSLIGQLQDARRRAQELVAGLNPEQLTRRPDLARWSIAECLAHLNTTAKLFHPFIDSAIQKGREAKVFSQGPFNPGPMGRLLMWIAEPPPKFKFKAPTNILPSSSISDATQVVAEFMRVQDEWERELRDSDGLDLKKIKCSTPFAPLGGLRLRLADSIPWMLAHQRRHLQQAEGVKAEITKLPQSQKLNNQNHA